MTLEEEPNVAPIGRNAAHLLIVEVDLALRGLDQAGDHAQGGLATARRTQQRDELAVGDVEIHAVPGDDRTVALGVTLTRRTCAIRSFAASSRPGTDASPFRAWTGLHQVCTTQIARSNDAEEQSDEQDRDRDRLHGNRQRGRRIGDASAPDQAVHPQRGRLLPGAGYEQRDQELVEHDHERQQDPRADARSDQRQDDSRERLPPGRAETAP